jgi:hypothetical protein
MKAHYNCGADHPRWRGGVSKMPEHRAWLDMIKRCYNPRNSQYKNYGGRGIKVCDRWLSSFQSFLNDIGRRPSAKHSLDRFPNNDGNYEPGNVRWATIKQQLRNKRNNRLISYKGLTKTITEWAEQIGISAQLIQQRLTRGWTVDDALSLAADPVANYGHRSGRAVLVSLGKESMSVAAAARRLKIPASTIYSRISRGMSIRTERNEGD